MNDNSQEKREENIDNAINSSGSFLSTTMQPIFHNSYSGPPLSRFLTLPFVFSVRTISLIDQSVKGYFQFAHFKKSEEQVLDLLPLEKVDEYYFPEEIEEEIIVPSNLPGSPRRKITSSSHSPQPSHSPHLGQTSEKMSSASVVHDAVSNADSFGKAPSEVNYGQQQSQIDSPQIVSDNINHRKKSSVNTQSKEMNHPDLSSSANNNNNNKQSPQFITETEKYPSEKLAKAFRSKTKSLPRTEDQSNIKKSSSSKVHTGVIVSSEGPQLFPWKNSEPAKLSPSSSSSSSISVSRYNTSSPGLNESKPASTSSKSHKSKVIAEDDNNDRSPESQQFTNIITKRIFQPSSSSDSNKSSSSSIQPNVKIPIKRDSNNDSALDRSETHKGENSNNSHVKSIRIGDIVQTKEIATPADKSPNLPKISQSAQDSSFGLMRSRDSTKNTFFASTTTITPSTKIDDNRNNIIKPYNLPAASISDGKQKPTITINKLEVHVVGSNNNNVQRPMLNRSMDIADSHRHKLDSEDLQVNTETLNKSYLWKYKVRLS